MKKNILLFSPLLLPAVAAAQEDILSGKITVPSAIGDTSGAVEALRDSVRP